MALTLRDPLGGDVISDMFRTLTSAMSTSGPGDRGLNPMRLDVKETDKNYEITADVPGVQKENLQVTLDGDTLNISVRKEEQKDEDKEERGVKYHRVERSTNFVARAVRLPDNGDLDNINAKFENGVLRVEVPKKPEQQPEQKRVNVG